MYTPLSFSTIVQSSWAMDTLITGHNSPSEAIDKGLAFLVSDNSYTDKAVSYPARAGLPGHFYIRYHSYPHIWPLLALSHYKQKYYPES